MKTHFNLGQNKRSGVTFAATSRTGPSHTLQKWLPLFVLHVERLREAEQLAQGHSAERGQFQPETARCGASHATSQVHICSEANSRGHPLTCPQYPGMGN